MEAKELINRVSVLKSDVYKYITDTEHWLFYWITNKEVQDFIEEYPEDYEDRVHLQVNEISSSPSFEIQFDDHPDDVTSIKRYAGLFTFRDAVEARWLEWNNKIKELQIKDKEKELSYYKQKLAEVEKELSELKEVV